MNRLRHLSPFVSFGVVFIAAIIVATILFRAAQHRAMNASADNTPGPAALGALTDTQKLYLESRLGTSQLLFNIAFAIIGGLLALHFSEKTRPPLSTHAVFSAAGLLLASIYSAFLFQIGVSHCLEGSPNDLFSAVLNYPIVAQFWFLFAAVILIAISLMRRIPSRAGLIAVAIVWLSMPSSAYANAAAKPDYAGCVRKWASERQLEIGDKAVKDGAALIKFVVGHDQITVADARTGCTLASTLLDQVRFQALEDEDVSTPAKASAAVERVLHDGRVATQTTNVSFGELVDELISIAEVWRVAAGIVDFDDGRRGQLFVTVMSRERPPKQRKGRTPWIVRLPPGKYDVTASEGAQQVYTGVLEIKDGDRMAVPLRGPR